MELKDKIYTIKLLDEYGDVLTKKQKDVLTGYYMYDLSLSEIAENEGTTRQAAYDLVTKSTKALFDMENKIGKLKQNEEVVKQLNRILKENDINLLREKIKQLIKNLE